MQKLFCFCTYLLCSCSFGGLLGHISNNTLIKKEVNRIYLLLLIVFANFIPIYTQGRNQWGGATAPQSSKKPFFQNIEIRVEKCCWGGGLSDCERRPVLEFIAKLSDYFYFQSKANKELIKKSFLFSINLMVS